MTDVASKPNPSLKDPNDPGELFDSVGPAYEEAFAGLPSQLNSLTWLISILHDSHIPSAKILDIGTGTGRPTASILTSAGHQVLGIDVSASMVKAARERVPDAKFEQVDVRTFKPEGGDGSLDAVTCYFSLIAGFSQDEIRDVFRKVYGWLKPGGRFVFGTVPVEGNRTEIKWMGRQIVVSSFSVDGFKGLFREIGFEVEFEEESKFLPMAAKAGICDEQDVWEEPHFFVYARKP